MQVSNFVVFGVVEAFLLLLAVCVFLLVRTRNLKGMVQRLQKRMQALVDDLRKAKAAQRSLENTRSDYGEQLKEQLQLTRQYHQTLNAGQDIALDLNLSAPPPRQVAALRHAFLIAETEALHAGDDGAPSWQVLHTKLQQLIDFYTAAKAGDSGDEPGEDAVREQLQQQLQNSEQRVANLEKFKQLFFDMEDQWQQAQQQAQLYYQQLTEMAAQVPDSDAFQDLLHRYNHVYDQLGGMIDAGGDGSLVVTAPPERKVTTIEITRTETDKRAQTEIQHLRQVAEDQHQTISKLQKKLAAADTAEQRQEIIRDLSEQLERQTRFVRESETCIQLLEDELSANNNRVRELEERLANAGNQIPELQQAARQLSEENRRLVRRLQTMEAKNEQLLHQYNNRGAGRLQQDMLKLQQQYAKLEEKYLALRMKS